MRSAPALAECSNTRREPSMFSSRVASLASRIANARCTTTSAPFTRSRTLASSVTSPCRYSVFFQPRSAGSNGRRAMPTMLFTVRERSSALTIAMPRSPVGPVTATVSRSAAMAGVLSQRRGGVQPVLAAGEEVDLVGGHAVLLTGAAAHAVAAAVVHVEDVVPAPGRDRVAAGSAGRRVVPGARTDAVVAAAALDRDRPAQCADDVVAAAAENGDARALGEDRVVVGASVHEVGAEARVEAVGAGAAEEPVRAVLAEQLVVPLAAQHLVLTRAGVDHVTVVATVDGVVPGAADDQVDPATSVDRVVARPRLQVVVGPEAEQRIVAALPVELVRAGRALKPVGRVSADQRARHGDARHGQRQGGQQECAESASHDLSNKVRVPVFRRYASS